MPLVYRAVLQDDDGSIATSVEPLFRDWLLDKGLIDDEFRLLPGSSMPLARAVEPAWLQHQHAAKTRSGGDGIRRLRLVEETSEGRWITSVVWRRPSPQQQALELAVDRPNSQLSLLGETGADPHPWVWVDLEHEPSAGRPLMRPGSPKIVRSLMAAGEARDATLPLTADAFTVRQQHVAELVGYIRDPQRQVPIVVFAYDGQRAYNQADLARRLARDLAGVAAVFVLADAQTNQTLASALPAEFAVFAGALRTYLPGAGEEGDTPGRHRTLGRVSLAALGPRAFPALKDQVLATSTRRPGPIDSFIVRRLATPDPAPAQVLLPARPKDEVSPLQWLTAQVLRIRSALGRTQDAEAFDAIASAQAALAAEIDLLLRTGLAQGEANTAPSTAEAVLRATEARLAAIDEDRRLLEQLFKDSSDELKEIHEALTTARLDRDLLELELAEATRAADKLRRRAGWLERQVTAQDVPTAVDDDVDVPESVAEVVQLARDTLSHLVIGPTDAQAAELDVHSGASLYAARAWDALVALDAFAAARSASAFSGNFRQWCLDADTGTAAFSAQAVALNESETVNTSPALYAKRVFPVPSNVSTDRDQYMPAHVKLVKRGEAAPRLHFHDDAGGSTGKVYVGYIGPHLPTARFG
jgi:hypothetical protein